MFRRIFAVLVLALGIAALYLALNGALPGQGDVPAPPPADGGSEPAPSPEPEPEPEGTSFATYSFEKLSAISAEIAAAGGGDASREVARSYGLVDDQGRLTDEVRYVQLDNGRELGLILIGICHDKRPDGSLVGLTLMADRAIAMRPMNANGENEGGWEASDLRAWLAGEGMDLLPDDLADRIVAVAKATNNTGPGRDVSLVTDTNDKLWLLSAREVVGEIDWNAQEYGSDFSWWDDLPNAEGEQYERFAAAHVASESDPNGVLVRNYGPDGVVWWYRTPFYLHFDMLEGGSYFYTVLAGGYPAGHFTPESEAGVVVAFCI